MKGKGIYVIVTLVGLWACIVNLRKIAEPYYEDYSLCYGLNETGRNNVSDNFKYNLVMNNAPRNYYINNNAWNVGKTGIGWNDGMYGTGLNSGLYGLGWNNGFSNHGCNMGPNNVVWNGNVNNIRWSPCVIGSGWSGSMFGNGWNNDSYCFGLNCGLFCTCNFSTLLPMDDLIPIFLGGKPDQVKRAKWTFMVYLDADNNLEDFGIEDFLEMAEVGSNKEVNIIVQFDRINGYDYSYDDWTTCKRFRVTQGMTPTSEEAIEDLGEINMGSSDTLTDFINWSVEQYPAMHYALVLWNHGDGWRRRRESLKMALKSARNENDRDQMEIAFMEKDKESNPAYKGVCTDDTDGRDCLLNKEIQEALLSADIVPTLIGFDACLMGMIEVGYQISDTGATVLVASEELEPGPGWPYDRILEDLVFNPDVLPSELGTLIVDRYFESYGYDMTLSAIDLTHMGTLADKITDLAESIQNFWFDEERVRPFAQMLMDEIDMAVIHNQHGSYWPGAYGLAIYFPSTYSKYDEDYNEEKIDFAADTLWDDFLADFCTRMQNSWISIAKQVSQGFYIDNHIDLYDFCLNLITESKKEYIETFIPHEFNGAGTILCSSVDDVIWTYVLPFDFPFYGKNFSTIYISSNGFIDFRIEDTDYWNNFNKLANNVRIAPLWTDIIGDVYVQYPSENSFCIRWEGYEFNDRDPINVELVLYIDGSIQFNYGSGNRSIVGCAGVPPSIGISAGNGINYHISSFNGIEDLSNINSILYTLSPFDEEWPKKYSAQFKYH